MDKGFEAMGQIKAIEGEDLQEADQEGVEQISQFSADLQSLKSMLEKLDPNKLSPEQRQEIWEKVRNGLDAFLVVAGLAGVALYEKFTYVPPADPMAVPSLGDIIQHIGALTISLTSSIGAARLIIRHRNRNQHA